MTTLLATAITFIGTAVPAYVFAPSSATEIAAVAILAFVLHRVSTDVIGSVRAR